MRSGVDKKRTGCRLGRHPLHRAFSQDEEEHGIQSYYKCWVSRDTAAQDEIKRAYRKLVRKYHPDVNTGDAVEAEKTLGIGEATRFLQDPEKPRPPTISWVADCEKQRAGVSSRAGLGEGFEFSGGGYPDANPNDSVRFLKICAAVRPGGPDWVGAAVFNAPGQDHHAKIVIELVRGLITRHP